MLFWQNWLQFLILVLGSLVIVVVSVMFLLLFSRYFEVFCVSFFLTQLGSGILYPHDGFLPPMIQMAISLELIFVLETLCHLVAVQPCLEWMPAIKKKETGVMQATLQWRFFLFFLGVASTHKNFKFTSIKIPSTPSTIGRGIMEFPGRN